MYHGESGVSGEDVCERVSGVSVAGVVGVVGVVGVDDGFCAPVSCAGSCCISSAECCPSSDDVTVQLCECSSVPQGAVQRAVPRSTRRTAQRSALPREAVLFTVDWTASQRSRMQGLGITDDSITGTVAATVAVAACWSVGWGRSDALLACLVQHGQVSARTQGKDKKFKQKKK